MAVECGQIGKLERGVLGSAFCCDTDSHQTCLAPYSAITSAKQVFAPSHIYLLFCTWVGIMAMIIFFLVGLWFHED